ncbi:MAG TPA: thiamine pyrophosphate-binding protein [Gaiellales bacterium]|nr:thiamine pyrophosphate-binding protein [Gaiellales bacterium]
MTEAAASTWQAELARALAEGGVEAAAWVPDKRLAPVAEALEALSVPVRTLTREEECVGWAAGYRAAGGTPLVLMQCSGLGNSLNAIGSLVVPYGLGFPLILSMRGALGERNPAQMALGRTAVPMLELLGIQAFRLGRPGEAGMLARGALNVADGARQLAPIVLEPELDMAP